MGNGQYSDPQSGRFLTRDTKSGQANPYVPWKSDPVSAMLAPLAMPAGVYARKKKRGKWDTPVILLVLSFVYGVSLLACSSNSPSDSTPTQPPPVLTVTESPTGTTVSETNTPVATSATVKSSDEGDCTLTLLPNNSKTPKAVYLTFDDGPDLMGNTAEIAADLVSIGVKATFFVSGAD